MLVTLAAIVVFYQLFIQIFIRSALRKLARKQRVESTTDNGISVIVCTRNEKEHIEAIISDILNQSNILFELVVVDDHSDDGTLEVIKDQASHDQRIKYIELDASAQGKKEAIRAGVMAAKYERLAFTDADCRISDKHWLEHFNEAFDGGADLCIGVGAYDTGVSLRSKLYSLEALRSAMFYQVAALHDMPYMCVGRSMAYTKTLFSKVGGFQRYAHLASGSDDLFLQEAKRHGHIVALPHAVSWSKPPATWNDWVIQKKRHLSTGQAYPIMVILALMFNEISVILLPVLFMLGIGIHSTPWLLLVLLIMLRYTLFVFNVSQFQHIQKVERSSAHFWWLEWPMSCVNALISGLTLAVDQVAWKKRN